MILIRHIRFEIVSFVAGTVGRVEMAVYSCTLRFLVCNNGPWRDGKWMEKYKKMKSVW